MPRSERKPSPERPAPDPAPPATAGSDRSAPTTIRIETTSADVGARLDVVLSGRMSDHSRSRIQSMIRSGHVRIAGATIVEPSIRVKLGDSLTVEVPPPAPATPAPETIPLAIVYEDQHLIVLDKPAGLVVHPAAGHASGTLVNALIAHCGDTLSGIGGVRRPGIVHRIDKDTSGLLVVAKTDAAHKGLSEQFAAHGADGRLSRVYLALVWGAPRPPRGSIDAALARSRSNRTKIAVTTALAGRRAVTHYQVERRFPLTPAKSAGKSAEKPVDQPVVSQLRLTLETGRTHQIRVHLAHIGHPLLGDRTYGAHFAASSRKLPPAAAAALTLLGRQALHAAHLGFVHPVTGRALAFDSPLPGDFQALIDALPA